MLVTIRNARSITCDQICALLLNNGQESSRRSVHWRLARLEQNGLVERIDCGRLLPEPVFAITHSGLELLELRGHALVSLPSTTKEIVRRSQVLHSVELAGICTALTTAHVLTSWQWELEVLSQNLVYGCLLYTSASSPRRQTFSRKRADKPYANARDSSTMRWARSTLRTPTMAQRWQTDGAILSATPSTIFTSGRTP